jgi:hypothetical protein
VVGRRGAAQASAHTSSKDQKFLLLDHTEKNSGAILVTRPDLNRQAKDKA